MLFFFLLSVGTIKLGRQRCALRSAAAACLSSPKLFVESQPVCIIAALVAREENETYRYGEIREVLP